MVNGLKMAVCACCISATCLAGNVNKDYTLWYKYPAPNRGADYDRIQSRGLPYDEDWEHWSLPIGNGYMGASLFGRTDTERIQLSEKTLGNRGCYNNGGFTSFAEIYLDIYHYAVKNYRRTLNLNDAVSGVSYEYKGVRYEREYLANYPDNVIAVKLKADKPGQVSLRVRPILPYLSPNGREGDGRTGETHVQDDVITLSGEMEHFRLSYEAQVKVLNYGGSREADAQTVSVNRADSVVLLITAATSYRLDENVFLLPPAKKFEGNEHPHRLVSERIAKTSDKGYEKLKKEHLDDYHYFFNRAGFSISKEIPAIPTDELVQQYKSGKYNPYLEELFFQYGRYLLIASSRDGSLPPNLQGAWTQYDYSPWSGGYWHNVNVQMNYWHVFNTNLSELFDPFMQYNEAYREAAQGKAADYIRQYNPSALSAVEGGNGWTIGTNATAFGISGPGGHSGPGTGGFTTKLFWDYYDFTRDRDILERHVYPALLGMAKFLSKTLVPADNGLLLVSPSYSPEQQHQGSYYKTVGCAFDQGMIWECFNDLLLAADILKKKDPFLKVVKEQIAKLDPILIGESGQIKEYREETTYGSIGDPRHRHLSHMCTLYPGTLINPNRPDWMRAAAVTLENRGDKSTGWAMAHRLNLWARVHDGDSAYRLYRQLLSTGIVENLWDMCPPFQIDGNFGGTAGVAEMLLQSHAGYIEPLAALPKQWNEGQFRGLVARGNFVIDADWKEGKATCFNVLSRKGGACIVQYKGIAKAEVVTKEGKTMKFTVLSDDRISFKTKADERFSIKFK